MPPRGGRHRPSTIDRLDPEIKDLIGKLRIDFGWTIDEILKRLRELGQGDISRSALGRHVRSIEEIGADLRQSREMALALVGKVGDAPDDRVGDLNIELMQTMMMRMLTSMDAEGDGQPLLLDPKDQKFLSGAIKDLAGARKLNADMVLKVRDETRREAAKNAVAAAKSAGLTADTVELIRKKVLGSEA